MNWLVSIGLTNAILATLLAAIAWAIARFWRQPALAHLLWVVVLLKLLTPPLIEIPIGWRLDADWIPAVPQTERFPAIDPSFVAQQPLPPPVAVNSVQPKVEPVSPGPSRSIQVRDASLAAGATVP